MENTSNSGSISTKTEQSESSDKLPMLQVGNTELISTDKMKTEGENQCTDPASTDSSTDFTNQKQPDASLPDEMNVKKETQSDAAKEVAGGVLEEETDTSVTPAGDLPQDESEELCPRDAGFTSEKFKIEITGLPRRFGFKELRKRLSNQLGLKPHKLKAIPMKGFAFVCFSSEEDRDEAMKAIKGHVWKGRTWNAKFAQPAADPMKRKLDGGSEDSERNKKQKLEDDDTPPSIRLKKSVMPLWEMPYEDQLQVKTGRMKEVLKAVAQNKEARDQFMKARKENNGMCCALEPVTPSPVLEGYRNKSEFSIGRSEDGTETVVGFRFGLYRNGTDCVGSPTEISIISPQSKAVVESFQKFLCGNKYEPWDHRTHRGHWRQLTVRTSQGSGGVMAIVEFVGSNTTQEEREAEKEAIKKYFTEGQGQSAGVTTFFFRPCSSQTSNPTSEEPYELIYGDGFIFESLMGMKFRVSPSAFFQVNTASAEVLYKLIADWCGASPTTTLLDICCGTGTIGLSLAKRVKEVIGIEMCTEAVEDAKVNAELNGVTNCKYRCAKVQDVIHDLVRNLWTSDVVAVLDPPRAGMPPSVIKCLRTCKPLQRIVYAACHPQIAKINFIDLVRPATRKHRGEPFKFVRAMPVDMFPQTNFCELLVLFERDTSTKKADSNEMKTEDVAEEEKGKEEPKEEDSNEMKTENVDKEENEKEELKKENSNEMQTETVVDEEEKGKEEPKK